MVTINETKLGQRLSGFLEDSRTQPNEDIKSVYQPIMQICAFSEMCRFSNTDIPLISLYGDRETFRPFLYFPEHDVLLTTKTPFTFHCDNQVHVHALATINLLFRIHEYPFIRSKLNRMRTCGWLEAKLKNEPRAYADAWLSVEEDGVETRKEKPKY